MNRLHFTELTDTERTELVRMRDALRDHADALDTMLQAGTLTDDVRTKVEDFTDGYHHRYSVYSYDLPKIVSRLREGRCPNCEGTVEHCDCP